MGDWCFCRTLSAQNWLRKELPNVSTYTKSEQLSVGMLAKGSTLGKFTTFWKNFEITWASDLRMRSFLLQLLLSSASWLGLTLSLSASSSSGVGNDDSFSLQRWLLLPFFLASCKAFESFSWALSKMLSMCLCVSPWWIVCCNFLSTRSKFSAISIIAFR